MIALLLPAVQAAREAARRMQCTNNLKQIGLGLHNYHDASIKSLPRGTVADAQYGTYNSCNWRSSILPYMEQQALYSNFLAYTGTSGYRYMSPGRGQGWPGEDVVVSVYRCPSNGRDPFDFLYDLGRGMAMIDYIGIAGAEPDPVSRPNVSIGFGMVSKNGTLIFNRWTGLSTMTDGTSNTIVVGEQSSAVTIKGVPDVRSSNLYGGWLGTSINAGLGGPAAYQALTTDSLATITDRSAILHLGGTTTVRYPINFKHTVVDDTTYDDLAMGVAYVYCANTALVSNHTGGANFVLGDGSVHFLSDTTSFITLAALSTANDGQAVSIP
ncbi:MAG: DUF1559 domain-containing protein [Planctomycetaceae bacterium]|nr:DUF1559 domain-containing protein [Planctomycetaceae bacterium]